MQKDDEEQKLTDILIGEAVLTLLRQDAVMNTSALIDRLQAMASGEHDTLRQRACRRAISEVRASRQSDNGSVTQEVRDHENVMHMFNNDGPSDDSKKH